MNVEKTYIIILDCEIVWCRRPSISPTT